jgi:hypothetical protein
MPGCIIKILQEMFYSNIKANLILYRFETTAIGATTIGVTTISLAAKTCDIIGWLPHLLLPHS